jgi:hypothetical protein
LREGEPVSVQELPQGQKRPLSTYQASALGQGRDICGSSSSLNHLHQQHQHHTPPTPPPVWEWNNQPNPNPNPSYPMMPNQNVNMANGYLNNNNIDQSAFDLSGLSSNPPPNGNVNGNMNGNGGPAMDSFFDHGLFGGLTPTVGMGLDGTNGNGNEDDLWTQLFGTFP